MAKTKSNEDISTSNVSSNSDPSISIESETEEHISITEVDASQLENVEKASNGFEGFGFSEALLKTLKNKGYEEPTPIQKASIPELMLGRDLLGQAQTGTGKTAAFALPLLERINSKERNPQVLVLTPTRELAMQVAESFKAYSEGHANINILAVYGGSDFRSQIYSLKRGVEIIVGTPGRVMDHIRQGTLNQDSLQCLVLDEADEMLRMGFIDDIEWILEQLPNERQMVLFSATMPPEIRKLSKRYLRDPAEITIKAKKKEAQLIRQHYITVQNSYKLEVLRRVLELNYGEGVIIFARTKAITLKLAESLEASNHNVAVLNGDVPQNLRERTVERLRQGGINILVATDVAARGLDVERIGLVINYDMPFDSEAYVHRIGRTGRAGRSGEAILFISPRERSYLNNLERAVGQSIERMEIPNNESINNHRIQKIKRDLLTTASQKRKDQEETNLIKEVINEIESELEITPKEIALAAINLSIGESPLLINTDESWINQAERFRKSNDRRDNRGRSRRRNDLDIGTTEKDKERFRVDVGHRDRVKPGNIVGAIANESGLNGRMIGRIQIFESYSLVDLPKGMPTKIFQSLKRVKVMNKELNINRYT
ncbi:DEAD/DEAH box helicase [Prochlorococcus marinus]|uniref:ATP-dependent RNA helicase DeaD n=1 Tax=Prochlorococcus marinus (strain SARG / CCMP1375 / SS120) TaxID=167539 RepID=Q7VBJ8_PROMA|nr:DEAD/DEAH box helicase [Prochlorococcus marinus]AAQ00139.1 Superfamily II DNA/RNA helicase [Prochlorococcus marinus subsp. marinus str. CCMP1375]KGG13935.1 Cold-shock DEAD-box protein A [Prochlorococcus marinus str. LG]KGG19068.1 Cold-shock DEAD-box protein A [Prochlorococcus marinus str. SS2]KGG23392.1 Cold-shock DEAD-box protein A [Prochlorococcus marinus str. SS35]KGG32372.1 Cold-shock DEAD-box protein A [Prochlorococcus marinus str. SS51]